MNPDCFREFNSTYYVNRRRKEAILTPLQDIIEETIHPQLSNINTCLYRLLHHPPVIAAPEDNRSPPSLQQLSVQSILEDQAVTLQEILAQTERAIDILLADTEDIDPLSTEWQCQALHTNNQGLSLIKGPTVYLPLTFYHSPDHKRIQRSIPINPSEYLPSDEEYFEAAGCLEPPTYVVPTHRAYLDTQIERSKPYHVADADEATNKFYCRLEPPPPLSNQPISLPHSGDTYLRDGSPFYKKLDLDDIIYIPHIRTYGRALHWINGTVTYKPTFHWSRSTNNNFNDADHWVGLNSGEEPSTIPFGSFVIAIPSTHPTRRLLAYVSPYTTCDSSFLLR